MEGADALFAASESASGTLVASMIHGMILEPVTHRGQVRVASVALRKDKVTKEKATVELMKVGAPKKLAKRLERIGQCGIWLSVAPLKLGGSCLFFDKFMDALLGWYGLKPLGLCNVCDG